MAKTLAPESEVRLCALYRSGTLSLRELAERFGLSHEGVRGVLRRNDVPLNSPHRRLAGRTA